MKLIASLLIVMSTYTLAKSEQAAVETKTELKVMSWNIFMIPKPVNWTYQQERAEIIAKQLKESENDIMFFQESFSGPAKKKITKGLAKTHPYSAETKKRKFGTIQGSGLMVVSKHPMEVVDEIIFKNCTHSDCLARKGALLVEVTLPDGKKAQFVNTHMQAWSDERAVNVRRNQFTEIKELMARNKRPGVPQFLIGDLNVDGKKEEEFKASLELLSMEAGKLQGELQATNGFKVDCYKTPGEESEGQWLDHLWYNPSEGAQVIQSKVVPRSSRLKKCGEKDCPLSDHHSVESVINL